MNELGPAFGEATHKMMSTDLMPEVLLAAAALPAALRISSAAASHLQDRQQQVKLSRGPFVNRNIRKQHGLQTASGVICKGVHQRHRHTQRGRTVQGW